MSYLCSGTTPRSLTYENKKDDEPDKSNLSSFSLVEVAGLEPASKQGTRKLSTRLVAFRPPIRARQATAKPESQPLNLAR